MDLVRLLVELLAPDASPDAYNDWRLVATTRFSDETLVAIAVILAAALALSIFGLRGISQKRRLLLIALRTLGAAVVFAILLMPAVELRAVSKVRSRVALLVDSSGSMGLATPEGKTRAELVEDHLERNAAQIQELRTEAIVETSLFGARARVLDNLPSPLPTDETRTDIARALSELGYQASGRDLGAVVLYSDGTDTEGLTPERARQIAEDLECPIYAIGFGADSSARDLAIRRIVTDDFAFVHNTVALDVEVEQRGLSLSSVLVTMKRDDEVLATKEAVFDASGKGRVTFEFKPNRIGKRAYQVSVPVQQGEAVQSNNARSVVIKVIRDRIRVLQVAGRPSWDERFLRELLKRNPNVDLISFFILRTTNDLQKAAQDELALIPFPVEDLFTTEIDSFDVVIYQNFTFRPYNMARFLPRIRQYVEDGGSFLMIGGNDSFEDGWYANTPLASVLPIRLGGAGKYETTEFMPRLTQEGRRHPITRIGEPGEPPSLAYQRLPPLAGFNQSFGLMPDAHALLVHPSLPGNPPVVAIRDVGEGRTMAVATDSLWFWRFVSVGNGRAGREFDRFWNNAFRWLIRDPELARIRAQPRRAVHSPDEPVTAEIRVLGTDYHGLAGADVRAELIRLSEGGGDKAREVSVKTGEDGNAIVTFGEVEPGNYILETSATHDGDQVGEAQEPIIVEAADVEVLSPFPNPTLMRALAEASGGAYAEIDDALPDVEIKDLRRVEIDRTRRVPIWDTFFVIGLLLAVVGSEWWIRRGGGLF